MKIYFASDHAGFELKNALVEYVRSLGHDAEDLGAHTLEPQDDYPGYMFAAARAVAADSASRGIILGGSGQGEAMAANRVPGVRAAVCYAPNQDIIRLSREHNDANVLSLGARFLSEDAAKAAVKLWLETPFSGEERHARRIKQLDG